MRAVYDAEVDEVGRMGCEQLGVVGHDVRDVKLLRHAFRFFPAVRSCTEHGNLHAPHHAQRIKRLACDHSRSDDCNLHSRTPLSVALLFVPFIITGYLHKEKSPPQKQMLLR